LIGAAFGALVLGVRGELRVLVQPLVAWRLLVVGALGTAAAYMLFFSGAQRTTAVEAVVCLQIEPVYAMLLAWLGLGHRPSVRRLFATVAVLAGIVLALGGPTFSLSVGAWFLLATPVCWQLSHLVVLRGLVGVPPSVLTGARYIYGGVLLALYWLVGGGAADVPPTPQIMPLLPMLTLQGVVLFYIGTLLWYQAVTRLDLARTTAIVVPSIPLLSLGASFILLGEVPSAFQAMGMLTTVTGVLVFVTAPPALVAATSPLAGAAGHRPGVTPSIEL